VEKKGLLDLAKEVLNPPKFQSSSSDDPKSPTVFSRSFASENMTRSVSILQNADPLDLIRQWEMCIQNALVARKELEKELEKMQTIAVQNERRCFDYEPFIREYMAALMREGMLERSLTMAG
jgi:Ubiquitin carboxyl-terminal hydrolases